MAADFTIHLNDDSYDKEFVCNRKLAVAAETIGCELDTSCTEPMAFFYGYRHAVFKLGSCGIGILN